MLLKAKKILSIILAITFVAAIGAGAQNDYPVTTMTIDAQINNDNGRVTLSGEHNSRLSQTVSVTVFYPGCSSESFDGSTPINEIVALMAEITPQNGVWTYEFTLTDDMPWGDYTIYAGSDVYSYGDLYDTISFINSERKGEIISEFNVGEDKLSDLFDSFKKHSGVLSIDVRNDWDSVGNSVSLCFIKLRETDFDNGKLGSFTDVKNTYTQASKIYDFMQINDIASLEKYLEENSSVLGFDVKNTEYVLFKDKILADILVSMTNTQNAAYVSFYKGIKDKLIEKTVLYAVNNATKEDMDSLLKKYCGEIGISVTDKYASLDNIQVAKALYNKNFSSLADIKTAFDNRVNELTQEEESETESDNNEQGSYTPPQSGGGGGGSGGSSKPSEKDTVKDEAITDEKKEEISTAAVSFSDVNVDFWGYNAVSALASKNIINGFEDKTFAPQSPVTREQFLKIAVSAFDEMLSKGVNQDSFSDVDSDEWYAEYVQRGVNSGLINGITEDLFGIGKTISRQDAAVILYRAIKSQIDEIKIYGNFTDNSEISEYAKTPVYSLQNIGILSGNGSGYFNPADNLTRAEASQLVYNAMKFCNLFS